MANISYTLFPAVFNMSITASVAVVAIIVFRLFFYMFKISFKKIPSVIFYAMWAVVLFRLLCPVSITSPLSYFSRFESPVEHINSNASVMEFTTVVFAGLYRFFMRVFTSPSPKARGVPANICLPVAKFNRD